MSVLALIGGMLLAIVSPQREDARVHDFAGLLSAEQRTAIESIADNVELQTTAQLTVVTVKSLDGKPVETYAHELFEAWGIGRRKLNNGVLLLIAPNERRMWIAVGYGVEPLLSDELCGEIRDQQIVPRFKAGDYPGGILAGTQRLAAVLKSDPAAARGDPNSGPALTRTAQHNALWASGGVVVAAIVLLLAAALVALRRLYSTTEFLVASSIVVLTLAIAGFYLWNAPKRDRILPWFGGAAFTSLVAWGFNLQKYRRFGPHGCSKCGTQLELLSEQDDDPKLSAVQRLEEEIGSVDYDVWFCPACLNADTERYVNQFSSFKECPACHARTFKLDPQYVVRPASTTSAGTARIEGRCVSCNHKTVQNIMLPMIVENRNDGFLGTSTGGGGFTIGGGGGGGGGSIGGFGGGSSGGGGAGGGW